MPSYSPHWSESHFVVLDVEGNGGAPQEIVEIAVVHIQGGRLAHARDWTVRPLSPITNQATRVHGITNEDLLDKPSFADIASDLQVELGTAILVGHHVGVDISLIKRQLPAWKPGSCIDTLRLAKHVFPDIGSYSLEGLRAHIGENTSTRLHRAKADAHATARLFLMLASTLSQTTVLDFVSLARIGAPADDPILLAQQGSLFT